jgi:signal transduction histidine kinase
MNSLFPFYILINRDLTVDAMGKSITKLKIIKKGDPFFNIFTIERPLQTKNFNAIKRQKSALFIFHLNNDNESKFRGQIYCDEQNDQLCFLGSPLVQSLDELKNLNLTLTDFALHDNISQYLFALQMQLSSLKDSKNFADKLKKSNNQLKQSNNELQDFAYMLSHDLKSPLRGINSLAHFIEDDINNNNLSDLSSHIKTIKGRVARMENLINGVLDFTKIGMQKSKKEKINLNDLVRIIFEEGLTDENIVFNIESELPTIYNIQVLFIQLFSNLISNSIKYNDKQQGLISIGYKESNKFHEFSIKDNGPGIPKKYHDKIFQVFQTLNSKDVIESTGVGLSIVKKIITFLNGSIWLESKIDEGTTFYFNIPKN